MEAVYIGARSSTLLVSLLGGRKEIEKATSIVRLQSTTGLFKDTCASQSATGARQFKQTFNKYLYRRRPISRWPAGP